MSRIPMGFSMVMDVYDAPLLNSLTRLVEQTGSDIGMVLRKRSGALARYLAEATMPIAGLTREGGNPDGFSKAALTLGQRAVTRDIGRDYVSPKTITRTLAESNGEHGVAMAKGFTGFLKKGDLQSAKAILDRSGIAARQLTIIQWDGGDAHRKARNNRGRIAPGRKPQITTDAVALKKYSDMRRKNVGFAKGGWVNAARSIGKVPGVIPQWMKRHASPGTAKDFTEDAQHPRFELQNQVGYMTAIMDEKYLIQATVAFERSLKKEIEIVMKYLADKESK